MTTKPCPLCLAYYSGRRSEHRERRECSADERALLLFGEGLAAFTPEEADRVPREVRERMPLEPARTFLRWEQTRASNALAVWGAPVYLEPWGFPAPGRGQAWFPLWVRLVWDVYARMEGPGGRENFQARGWRDEALLRMRYDPEAQRAVHATFLLARETAGDPGHGSRRNAWTDAVLAPVRATVYAVAW